MKKTIFIIFLSITALSAQSKMAHKIGDKTIHFSSGEINIGGHRNWRNNNPGNLEYGKFAKENGAIGTDGRFAIFPTMKAGYIAQVRLLSGDKYKNKTLRQALIRYAPQHENNTGKYLSYLSKNCNISKNTKLKTLSFNKKIKLVKYMAKYEGMRKGTTFKSSKRFNKNLYALNQKKNNKRYLSYNDIKPSIKNKITKRRFNRLLNPKKTRLHKILLSN